MRSKKRRLLAFLTTLCLLVGLLPQLAFAAQFSDTNGHWAEAVIDKLSSAGIINGKGDGTFQPNASITRAEFFTLINKTYGYVLEVPVSFSDVSDSDWFAKQIRIAVAANYVTGYEDNTIHPNNNITRNEMAVVIAKVMSLSPKSGQASGFADSGAIPSWAEPYVGAVTAAKLVNGDNNGNFRPSDNLTRAEAAVLINSVRMQIGIGEEQPVTVSPSGDLTLIGNYGPTSGTETISGDVYITKGGVTLRNVVITGDLTITEDCFTTVVLNDVQVKGTVKMSGSSVTMSGIYNEVQMNTKAILRLTTGSPGEIDTLRVRSGAAGSRITVAKGAVVKNLVVDATVSLTGEGEIKNAMLNADGVTIESGLTITYASGSKKATTTTTKTSSGGGGSSSGSSSTSSSDANVKDDLTVNGVTGATVTRDGDTFNVKVPFGTVTSNLTFTINKSNSYATVSTPTSLNGGLNWTFTVTAQDGSTRNFSIVVTVLPEGENPDPSDDTSITVTTTVSGATVSGKTVTLPVGMKASNLVVGQITVTANGTGATVSGPTISADYMTWTFKVEAASGKTETHTITVKEQSSVNPPVVDEGTVLELDKHYTVTATPVSFLYTVTIKMNEPYSLIEGFVGLEDIIVADEYSGAFGNWSAITGGWRCTYDTVVKSATADELKDAITMTSSFYLGDIVETSSASYVNSIGLNVFAKLVTGLNSASDISLWVDDTKLLWSADKENYGARFSEDTGEANVNISVRWNNEEITSVPVPINR